jgi:hypothetical protein
MNDMNDPHREKIFRLRLNPAEFAALIRISLAANLGPCALLRAFIHENAPK